MIPLADPHENWMPMKGWKNQSSSISERERTRSYYYVHGPVGHQKLLQTQKFQRETWRHCQEWLRNKYIEPINLLCAHVRFTHCVHGPVAHQLLLQLQKIQRETWRHSQAWLRNKEIEILNLLCARARFTHCVPLACTDLKLISWCSNWKNFKGRPGGNAKSDSETKKLNS